MITQEHLKSFKTHLINRRNSYRDIALDNDEAPESRRQSDGVADELDCVIQEFFLRVERHYNRNIKP